MSDFKGILRFIYKPLLLLFALIYMVGMVVTLAALFGFKI
jgi:hypothetical protein